MDSNYMALTSLFISFASLTLACLSLYFAVFKKGKPEIHPFIEGALPFVMKTDPDSYYFFFNLHYCIANSGANSIAIYNLIWDLNKKEICEGRFRVRFIDNPLSDHKIWGYTILKPYQRLIRTCMCSGIFHVSDLDGDNDIILTLKYTWYKKSKMVRVKKMFPEFGGLINEVKRKAREGELDKFRSQGLLK